MASFPFPQFWSPFTLVIIFLTFALPALSKLHKFLIFYLNPFLSQIPKTQFFSLSFPIPNYKVSNMVPIILWHLKPSSYQTWMISYKKHFSRYYKNLYFNQMLPLINFSLHILREYNQSLVLFLLKTKKHFPTKRKSFSFSTLSSDFSFWYFLILTLIFAYLLCCICFHICQTSPILSEFCFLCHICLMLTCLLLCTDF